MNLKVGTILKWSGKLCKVTNVEVVFDQFEVDHVTIQVQGEIDFEFDLVTLQNEFDNIENLGRLHGHANDPLSEIEVG